MNSQATSTIVEITPAQAAAILKDCRYHAQRNLRPASVEYYAAEMRDKCFKSHTTIEIVELEGKRYLIDGQHRLNAVVASGIPQIFNLIELAVVTHEELADRYAQTDRGIGRTTSEQIQSLSLPEELGLTKPQTNALGSAVMFIRNNFDRTQNKNVSLKLKLSLMREYAPSAEYFYELAAGAIREMNQPLRRLATLSVALVTLRESAMSYSLSKVEDFWVGAIMDDGIQVGDPRKLAHRHLLTFGISGGGKADKLHTVSSQLSARYLAAYFNAYMENRQLTYKKSIDANMPIRIAGSSFTGKPTAKVA